MLQQLLYIPFKWALLLSFADVMCFFISVYLLIRVSEKCQKILFCFSKEERSRTFIAMVYHLIFSFPKLLFIEYHTIISEVCFNNREFHSSILGVIFGVIFTILGVILCFLGVISLALSIIFYLLGILLKFLSTFSVYFFDSNIYN